MKKILILSLATLLLPILVNAQAAKPVTKSADKNEQKGDPIISAIIAECKRINSLKLTPKKFTKIGEASTDLSYYIENNNIVKIIEAGGIGDNNWVNEYFYQSGRLIYVITNDENWVGDKKTTTITKTTVINDVVVKYRKDNTVTACTVCKYNDASKEYKLLKAYTTKKFADAL